MWVEVGEGTFCRRYDPWDVTVGVVIGSEGVLIVDTRSSAEEGRALLDDLRPLIRRHRRWVVNTHPHFDHMNGNVVVAAAATVVNRPATIDLGDRAVSVHHLGRGHTGADLVVAAPTGVVFAGDLIEESGPPAYDELAYPFEWPATNGRLAALANEGDRVVPGHGAVVDRAFVIRQQLQLEIVAQTIHDLWDAEVPLKDAVRVGRPYWPFPPAGLDDAVARGYAALADNASRPSGSTGNGG